MMTLLQELYRVWKKVIIPPKEWSMFPVEEYVCMCNFVGGFMLKWSLTRHYSGVTGVFAGRLISCTHKVTHITSTANIISPSRPKSFSNFSLSLHSNHLPSVDVNLPLLSTSLCYIICITVYPVVPLFSTYQFLYQLCLIEFFPNLLSCSQSDVGIIIFLALTQSPLCVAQIKWRL